MTAVGNISEHTVTTVSPPSPLTRLGHQEEGEEGDTNILHSLQHMEAGEAREVDSLNILGDKLTDFLAESTVALGKTVMLCVSALLVGILPGKGLGNLWPPYQSRVFGPEISTHFLDPYSFLHFEDGIISFLLWGNVDNSYLLSLSPEFKTFWNDLGGLMTGLLAGYLFEIFENSEYIINRFVRDHGTSQFYRGDSKINVFGDILSLGVGYSMSKVCTVYGLWWVPWLWLILSEILCALTFRDNLVLGFIQTVSPQQWIKDYQQEIVPPHLRGIMRAGYWDNKLHEASEYLVDRADYSWNYSGLEFSSSEEAQHSLVPHSPPLQQNLTVWQYSAEPPYLDHRLSTRFSPR